MDDRPPVPPIPHAGVHYPPPFLYAAGVLAGWLLHRWRPLPITRGPSMPRDLAAAAFVLGWVILFGSAFVAFRRLRTTLIPNRPATAFVTTGPYRFTRNPMYVSLVLLYIGVTFALDSWWPLLLLPLVVLAVDRLVIAREERYLATAFPTDYSAYRSHVRRWL